jgi:hypothetical protein
MKAKHIIPKKLRELDNKTEKPYRDFQNGSVRKQKESTDIKKGIWLIKGQSEIVKQVCST